MMRIAVAGAVLLIVAGFGMLAFGQEPPGFLGTASDPNFRGGVLGEEGMGRTEGRQCRAVMPWLPDDATMDLRMRYGCVEGQVLYEGEEACSTLLYGKVDVDPVFSGCVSASSDCSVRENLIGPQNFECRAPFNAGKMSRTWHGAPCYWDTSVVCVALATEGQDATSGTGLFDLKFGIERFWTGLMLPLMFAVTGILMGLYVIRHVLLASQSADGDEDEDPADIDDIDDEKDDFDDEREAVRYQEERR